MSFHLPPAAVTAFARCRVEREYDEFWADLGEGEKALLCVAAARDLTVALEEMGAREESVVSLVDSVHRRRLVTAWSPVDDVEQAAEGDKS